MRQQSDVNTQMVMNCASLKLFCVEVITELSKLSREVMKMTHKRYRADAVK